MGVMRNEQKLLVGKSEGDHLESLSVGERIILEFILGKQGEKL
jgi:hypothetical protein